LDSHGIQKSALERRVDSLKAALQDANQQYADVSNQLKKEIDIKADLSSQLEIAKLSLITNKSSVNVEVQVLEEENIELLKENKELRSTLATYKAQVEGVSSRSSREAAANSLGKRTVPSSDEIVPPSIEINKKQRQHVLVADAENCTLDVKGKCTPHVSESCKDRAFGNSIDVNQCDLESSTSRIGRKGRRANKGTASSSVARSDGNQEEQPGECAQS
jgi:hypothetical protein